MTTVKKSTPKKVIKYKTFKVCKDVKPFVQFNFTDQTGYWTFLMILILILTLWIIQIQINISDITNSVSL